MSVSIYVRSRTFKRSGKIVQAYQAGFQPNKGGALSEDKQEAIEYMIQVAGRMGLTVKEVIDSEPAAEQKKKLQIAGVDPLEGE